ncbi:glycerol dehydratase, cobalamin-independent, small subunit [Desulfocicer vacuolatum DSM 3385]|uniref:Glycerol dehydratase, cobalamin-independent, small subunit n=1 Tax=Desulfocicer vacuolatum DSM 3385 TaxID=1121400 RepID=A0A1W2CAJ8_9BACT|nr:glycyl-radical enzyme activating protein [Desulfocicer vacuolatum]SMC82307.1 glycerol dehydratase, cobalamin-independent, small subunit [Desulfocicer vacuolatum DSM 3385]
MTPNTVLNIQKFCIHDGPGIRTVVFLKGCTLACQWCANPVSQNPMPEPLFFYDRCRSCGQCSRVCSAIAFNGEVPQIDRSLCIGCGECTKQCPSGAMEMAGAVMTPDQVMETVEQDIVFYRNSGGGVTLSGGEPLMQPGFTKEILKRCRDLGIHTAVETAGCLPWDNFEKVIPHTDLFLYDVKHLDDKKHVRGTGQKSNKILKNLKKLCLADKQIILRIPVIPGFNDSETHIGRLAQFCRTLARGIEHVELLPYHNLGAHKYNLLEKQYELNRLAPPDNQHMLKLAAIMEKEIKQAGLFCRVVSGTV